MYQKLSKQLFNYHTRKVIYSAHRHLRLYHNKSADEKSRVKFDYEYLCDPQNLSHIEKLICLRKGVGNIRNVVELFEKVQKYPVDTEERALLEVELEKEASKIPNKASPHLFEYGEEPKVIEFVNEKPTFNFEPKTISEIGERLDTLRTEKLVVLTGSRSYYFKGGLADLEQALIRYTISNLLKRGFILMSVPDLLYSKVIESCGMNTRGKQAQVYRLAGLKEDVCLSGTAEMSLGGYLSGKRYRLEDLPLKIAAVSRCYRAETSNLVEERGIYRVHGFTKVEMFGVTPAESGDESHELYSEIIQIQKELFSQLGIHFQMLDMPLHDLGAPAYSKVDFEAWMPGRKVYGEISSASNCTDYQSRRLNITYKDIHGAEKFVHTVNGTACAIPRMLIALCETFQSEDGTVAIPPVLHPYTSGLKTLQPSNHVPCRMTWIKRKSYSDEIV